MPASSLPIIVPLRCSEEVSITGGLRCGITVMTPPATPNICMLSWPATAAPHGSGERPCVQFANFMEPVQVCGELSPLPDRELWTGWASRHAAPANSHPLPHDGPAPLLGRGSWTRLQESAGFRLCGFRVPQWWGSLCDCLFSVGPDCFHVLWRTGGFMLG